MAEDNKRPPVSLMVASYNKATVCLVQAKCQCWQTDRQTDRPCQCLQPPSHSGAGLNHVFNKPNINILIKSLVSYTYTT